MTKGNDILPPPIFGLRRIRVKFLQC